ncbi:AzlD domain-containing protein [Halopseudomonas yangmingensis]|uniref:Branched-chain amino acid transport protein n=1 Tax=Halopseudomonas yangmingensis TaxID=1720063 RepID=A0A1I4SUC2_9GAMM|nr:Branched-chain amino acid transport protein [Halopseudomonas yangmingensis]
MTLHEVLLIGGMALITFAIRYTLFAAGHRVRFSPLMTRALGYVPVAVLTAIIVPMMLRPEGQLALQLDNAWLFGGLAAIAVAAWRRNLLLTIFAGMACFLFWRWLF